MAFAVHRQPSKRHRLQIAAAMTAVALLAGGCASSKQSAVGSHAPSSSMPYAAPGSAAARSAVSSWSDNYKRNPKDKSAILGYSNALTQNSQVSQATAILRSAVINNPGDREIASAYGKILAMNGQFPEALNVLQGAQTPQMPDWRLLSAEGAVHDQMGNHDRARSLYHQALKIQPDEPSLLNNLALSHLLSNELPEAEYNLRRAAALPGSDSRIRQNLALVLGLQGKFGEAEQVATAELSQAEAAENVAYLRKMLSQSRG
ncbi:tetratricopeptide repeat protein [Roseibium suaedae]|uniref:Flp pilus assembly protein TadD, contains TPR repeats n=1 Tax=Roseibium suaedae TaxID=735517 RepID=A0A1M7A373_9HYPH|nr:tetratricopeptide repeat protein [Roseibium suaedae]SHL37202.1 Flp pilus assembly protein TadD, contains TPR repeats [Roseibium suaedae]